MRTRKSIKTAKPAASPRGSGASTRAGRSGRGGGTAQRTGRPSRPQGADRSTPRARTPGGTGAPDLAGPASSFSSSKWTLTPELETELAEIAAATGCELIHAEWKGGVLRLFLDRAVPPAQPVPAGTAAVPALPETPPAGAAAAAAEAGSAGPEGVTLGDCEHVAKQVSALLDVMDFGNGRYVLEVSSPGLDRELYRPSDYQRFLGRLARITYEAAGTPAGTPPPSAAAVRRRTVVARLAEFHDGAVTLIDDRTGERLELQLRDVRRARLEVEL